MDEPYVSSLDLGAPNERTLQLVSLLLQKVKALAVG